MNFEMLVNAVAQHEQQQQQDNDNNTEEEEEPRLPGKTKEKRAVLLVRNRCAQTVDGIKELRTLLLEILNNHMTIKIKILGKRITKTILPMILVLTSSCSLNCFSSL